MFQVAIVLVVILAVVAYVYKAQILAFIDKVKLRVKEATPEDGTPVAPPVVEVPVEAPKAPAVDFSKYKGWTVTEVIISGLHRGLTEDEKVAAKAAGVIFPDEAPVEPGLGWQPGFNLDVYGGQVSNPVNAGQPYAFSFTASKATQKVSLFGQPGAFFHKVSWSVTAADGTVVVPEKTQDAFGVGTELDTSLSAGLYTLMIRVDGTGQLGTQYNQW